MPQRHHHLIVAQNWFEELNGWSPRPALRKPFPGIPGTRELISAENSCPVPYFPKPYEAAAKLRTGIARRLSAEGLRRRGQRRYETDWMMRTFPSESGGVARRAGWFQS